MTVLSQHDFGSSDPGRAVPIPSDALGKEFGYLTETVTKRRTMAFAAGIGREDDLFFNDASEGGVVAPPGIVAALEWPTFVTKSYLDAINRDNATAFNGLVHGYQISEFFRPIRPGDRIETRGRIVALKDTTAGALLTAKLSTTDQASGEVLSVSWFGAMYRQTELDGAAASVETVPELRVHKDLASAPALSRTVEIPKTQAHVYTECADIWNPIHTERDYALRSGLPDIILHGTCTWCKALHALADEFTAPGSPLPFKRFGARFSSPVIPGTRISIEASDPRDGEVAFCVRRHDGQLALTNGVALLA